MMFSCPPRAEAQTAPAGFQTEVFGSAGVGHVFRVEDGGSGTGPNVGGGVGFRHSSGLGFEVQANRTLGLQAEPALCGIVNVTCEGSAREGVTGATIASFNLLYHFVRESRTQPYVTGGVGGLWSNGISAILDVQGERAVFREESWNDSGLALNAGGGVRIQGSGGLSFRPEVRWYHGTQLSRANVSVIQVSVSVGYSW